MIDGRKLSKIIILKYAKIDVLPKNFNIFFKLKSKERLITLFKVNPPFSDKNQKIIYSIFKSMISLKTI
jgi:hypothetical protein